MLSQTNLARANFPISGRPIHRGLWRAFGAVKLACCRVNARLGCLPPALALAVEQACEELRSGRLDAAGVVDALQGGAGTSTNMNANEVLAERAAEILGDGSTVDPLAHVNQHQSTNDTYPTALRVAAIEGLRRLEVALTALLQTLQEQEQRQAGVVKVGRTQLQDAVLLTLGRSFGAWAEAIARDRWRIHKCEERLRVVNLGGTAIGTGLGAPRRYIFAVVDELRAITGFGLARAENLVEATQNQDALVEVMGMLAACATNLIKIANDLRLLSSGPEAGFGELRLPARQAGSTIMPGKVNPVIPEAVIQVGLRVLGAQSTVQQALCLGGNLELHTFLPLVADELLSALDLLTAAVEALSERCIPGIEANVERCREQAGSGTAAATALAGRIGYQAAAALLLRARSQAVTVREQAMVEGLITAADWETLTAAEAVNRLGSAPVTEEGGIAR